jgi:hypothetical protein
MNKIYVRKKGFRREVDENCALEGNYIASSDNLVPMLRD